MIMNLFLFFCILVLNACVFVTLVGHVVVHVGYQLQLYGATLVSVWVGDRMGVVLLGAAELFGIEPGW